MRLTAAALVAALMVGTTLVPPPTHAGTTTPACSPRDGASRDPAPVTTTVAAVSPGMEETYIRWTRWNRRVTYGDTTALEGQVVTDNGAVARATVRLLARTASAREWTAVGSVATDSETGVFAFTCLHPNPTTDYRVVFDGDGYYRPSQAARRVRVARQVPDRMRQVAPERFRYAGAVRPRYVGETVRLQTKSCRRCRWRTTQTDLTNRRSRWAFSIAADTIRGRDWFRVVVPASDGYVRTRSAHVWWIRAD